MPQNQGFIGGFMSGSPKLKKSNPLIIEIACGVVFEKGVELDPFLMGVYWNEVLKGRYPHRELRPTITNLQPSLRGLFTDSFEEWVVQLESTRLFVNWRKTHETIYPHFDEVFSRFWWEYNQLADHFSQHLAEGAPTSFNQIKGIELIKINHIPIPSGNSYFDCSDCLASFDQLPLGGDLSKMGHFALESDVETDFGKVMLRINTGWIGRQAILILELRDLVDLAPSTDIDEAFKKADQKLDSILINLLTEEAKLCFALLE